jgi:15,16-dihydrobiliverdin:ferredoxin oxidoreductase
MRKLAEQHISYEFQLNHKQTLSVSIEEAEMAHGMPWTETIGSSDKIDPLLYMPFWEWQMKHMKENLTNLQPCDSVSKFSYNQNADKKARIVSHCYKSDEYRKIRMTYYDAGDNTQVFNSVWYPDPKYNLPVLGIDLLAFNRKKYLAIVDFQPLHENEDDHDVLYEHRMKPIKEQYDTLKGRMSSKFYDETQFFSQQMLFSRFEDETIVSRDLFPAFKRYVNLHNKLIREAEADEEQVEFVLEKHKAYDTYSAERDPATGLFAAMFGKDWAEDFVYDFLFSTSERHPNGLQIPVMGPPPPAGVGGGSGAPSSKPQKEKQMALK